MIIYLVTCFRRIVENTLLMFKVATDLQINIVYLYRSKICESEATIFYCVTNKTINLRHKTIRK